MYPVLLFTQANAIALGMVASYTTYVEELIGALSRHECRVIDFAFYAHRSACHRYRGELHAVIDVDFGRFRPFKKAA